MIACRRIGRSFGALAALRDVSFQLEDGQAVALMGANGAGKSTLFNILATLDPQFDGEAVVAGFDVRRQRAQVRERIGYVPGRFSLYDDLSVKENLDFFARAYGCRPESIEGLSPHIWESLVPFSGKRAGTLSGGMKQKLAFCCAMVHAPRVLLLDEPTTGIDPVSRQEMWDEIRSQCRRGVSVLVSTHYLDEAQRADRVLFLNRGQLLLDDSPQGILQSSGCRTLEEVFVKQLEHAGENA